MDAIGVLARCPSTVNKALFGMVLLAVAAGVFVVLAPAPTVPAEAAVAIPAERPWLGREAADHIIGPGGTLGPLFAGVTLGGSAPPAEIRERIAAFARANAVAIDLEIVDDELVAIRFDVTFGGCCGYEGVEALAMRIGQPKHVGGCGAPTYFYDNWALANDGTHVRGTVTVNRLQLRWERTLSFAEVVARAEAVLGKDRGAVAAAAADRWVEVTPARAYVLELPHAFVNHDYAGHPARWRPADRGLQLATDQRIVTAATFTVAVEWEDDRAPLVAHLGKPRIRGDVWTWTRGNRTITAHFKDRTAEITVALRQAP